MNGFEEDAHAGGGDQAQSVNVDEERVCLVGERGLVQATIRRLRRHPEGDADRLTDPITRAGPRGELRQHR